VCIPVDLKYASMLIKGKKDRIIYKDTMVTHRLKKGMISMSKIIKIIKKTKSLLGLLRKKKPKELPKDMDPEFREVYYACNEYTMTPLERMYALYKAVEHIVQKKIPGDLVECGVWKGGSGMIMAHTLLKMNEKNRKIYLYDTFQGNSIPDQRDRRISDNKPAEDIMANNKVDNKWCFSPLEEVKKNMFSTGYLGKNIVFVKGKVEDTLLVTKPQKIALLRLDTNWFASTHAELKHLFPLLSPGGILLIDDYGYWQGAKEAVDNYFKENKISILLNRIDHTGRIGIKT
jgi:hypothetical protein|tara:strand:- start:1 stop:864 length:864 start_codon:yes stop_codon:yes gene_type:complete